MKPIFLILSLCISTWLVGCQSVNSQPRSFSQLGEFSSYALNNNIYRVSFQTQRNLSHASAEEITLLHAAQTSLQHGFNYFKVLDDPSNRSQQMPQRAIVTERPLYLPYGMYGSRGMWSSPIYAQTQIIDLEPIHLSYSIECFQQQGANDSAFDARLILQSLGAKYGLAPTTMPPQSSNAQP